MTNTNINTSQTETSGQTSSALTFGNFQTQICGAMSMGLLQSQSEIAKTGAEMAVEFTTQQQASYQGQSTFLIGGYNASLTSASKQAEQMRMGAYGEFASAGIGIVGFVAPQMHKSYFSDTSKQLDTVSDKLTQQEHMLERAQKGSNLTEAEFTEKANQLKNDKSDRAMMIKARQAELIRDGGSTPKLLNDKELAKFEQDEFNRKKGYGPTGKHSYYNKDATPEEVSKKTKTLGAYHINGLDDEAIDGLSADDRTKLIEKLHAEIKSTKVEMNTLTNDLQRHMQLLQEVTQITNQGVRGTVQMLQAAPTAASKEAEAEATLANNSGSIAGGIAQNANQAKEGALSNAQNAMQSFGRVYDGMRG